MAINSHQWPSMTVNGTVNETVNGTVPHRSRIIITLLLSNRIYRLPGGSSVATSSMNVRDEHRAPSGQRRSMKGADVTLIHPDGQPRSMKRADATLPIRESRGVSRTRTSRKL